MVISPAEARLLAYFNGTIPHGIYPNCTLQIDCQLTGIMFAQIDYYPSLGGNVFYLSLFAIFLITHLVQGIAWKTWTYSIAMILGLVLECIGYYGRVALSGNPFIFNSFVIYLLCLTLAPTFFTASIYLCLSRLIPIYDPANTLSRFAPKTYTYLFICADLLALVLQSIGGYLSATANTTDESWTGIHVMLSGLVFQVFSLVLFSVLCTELAFRVYWATSSESPQYMHKGRKLHIFEIALVAATIFIIVRSIYRCAELAGGFRGKLANEEAPFMILEGVMIILACFCLTVCHPGWALGGDWRQTGEKTENIEGNELIKMRGNIDGVAEGKRRYTNIDENH